MGKSWTILKMLEWMSSYFTDKGIESARLNAEHILSHALHLKRMDLYLKFDKPLGPEELSAIKTLVSRRAKREPLQYILGSQPFRGVDIQVAQGVLIPRPETEEVVGCALKIIPEDAAWRILEIGFGSGAIAAAILNERESVSVTATDVSDKAFEIAGINTKRYSDRIDLLRGSLFEPVGDEKFDLIISNPPYCPEYLWKGLEPEVKNFEPREALVGGKDGLDFYRNILKDAKKHLREGGWIVLELGDGQAESVSSFAGDFAEVNIYKDLSGKERVFVAQLVDRSA